jgi:hypothetical protein
MTQSSEMNVDSEPQQTQTPPEANQTHGLRHDGADSSVRKQSPKTPIFTNPELADFLKQHGYE